MTRDQLPLLLLLPLMVIGSGACAQTDSTAVSADFRVAASIYPLGDVAQQILGPDARVDVLLPASASPHEFETKPAQVERLAGADVLLTVGLGSDGWAKRAAAASGNRDLRVLEFAELIPADALIPNDPHVWLDPMLMSEFVQAIGDTLARLHPQSAAAIGERTVAYRARLNELDRMYREQLAQADRHEIVVMHAAFGYLAARYGLRQVSVFETHMEEPSPGTLEQVVSFIREKDVRVLFVQPQMPPQQAGAIREATGVRVLALDPIGNPARAGYDGYVAMMESNLSTMLEGLSR